MPRGTCRWLAWSSLSKEIAMEVVGLPPSPPREAEEPSTLHPARSASEWMGNTSKAAQRTQAVEKFLPARETVAAVAAVVAVVPLPKPAAQGQVVL